MTVPMREERYFISRNDVRRGVTAVLYTLAFIGFWRSSILGPAAMVAAIFLTTPVPEWSRPVPRKEAKYVAIGLVVFVGLAIGIPLVLYGSAPAIGQAIGGVVHSPFFLVPIWAFLMWMIISPASLLRLTSASSGGPPEPKS